MSKKILLIHSSVDGHTVKILDKISSLIGEKRSVTKKCISEVSKDLIKQSDSIVIGASIRYGDHRKNLYEFVSYRMLAMHLMEPHTYYHHQYLLKCLKLLYKKHLLL